VITAVTTARHTSRPGDPFRSKIASAGCPGGGRTFIVHQLAVLMS
jgi:hypothetical protein